MGGRITSSEIYISGHLVAFVAILSWRFLTMQIRWTLVTKVPHKKKKKTHSLAQSNITRSSREYYIHAQKKKDYYIDKRHRWVKGGNLDCIQDGFSLSLFLSTWYKYNKFRVEHPSTETGKEKKKRADASDFCWAGRWRKVTNCFGMAAWKCIDSPQHRKRRTSSA